MRHLFYHKLQLHLLFSFFFFFNDTATTEIYTLSLHDALPISLISGLPQTLTNIQNVIAAWAREYPVLRNTELARSEEHTSELQSQSNLVCRLLLEKKKKTIIQYIAYFLV